MLRQYGFRITSKLRGKGIVVQWDYLSLTPLDDIMKGEKLRINFSGSQQYIGADISFSNTGILMLSLVQSVQSDEEADEAVVTEVINSVPTPEDAQTIEKWMNSHFDEISSKMCDLASQGKYSYTISADKLPKTELWKKLCDQLVAEGFKTAVAGNDGITVEIPVNNQAA